MVTATLDSDTCVECGAKDGIFVETEDDGPPFHNGCRCALLFLLPGEKPYRQTFRQWLKAQDAATQDKLLGKAKGKLYRAGKVSVSGFVDVRGNELTLDQLKRRERRKPK
ncbi:hypothetical protein CWO90_28525 [Bradyrhizobium sp. Leo121]|nr:hypothetical protein CWO90_28525 [Bradyrhizobium sp. Leo121]